MSMAPVARGQGLPCYIEPMPSAGHTISGAATSVALFIGGSPRGPVDRTVRITSFADYEREFGGLDRRTLLSYAVKQFYDNGGADACVLRLADPAARGSNGEDAAVLSPADAAFRTALVAAFGPGTAMHGLDRFTLLCVPSLSDLATILALQGHCRRRRAMLLVDSRDEDRASDVATAAASLAGADAMNAALYFPWVRSPDPLQGGAIRDFPPCGFSPASSRAPTRSAACGRRQPGATRG